MDVALLSLLGIVIALGLLMALTYRGWSLIWLAPALAALGVALSADARVLAHVTQIYMPALGGFVVSFFPLFVLGALFGKLMQLSGAADAVAQGISRRLGSRWAVLAVVLACALLTAGGVSLFVVAFACYPMALALFRQAQIPRRLIPGAIALGAFTFTMTALPGTPSIQNAIPMAYFGSTLFAAPGLGLLASAVMLGAGLWWMAYRVRQAQTAHEGFTARADDPPQRSAGSALPSVGQALLPVGTVVLGNAWLSHQVVPHWDGAFLASAQFGATTLAALQGMWSLILALLLGLLVQALQLWRTPSVLVQGLNDGAREAVMPLLNTASLVGFGAVVAALPGFAWLRDLVQQLSGDDPLLSIAIAVNVLAGITGSASGGMSIALQTMGAQWLQQAQAAGISPELLHRVTVIATGGLDALPHNGAVVTLLGICGVTHRESYLDILVVAVLAPLLALALVIAVGARFGAF